jgi:hypothetical protein
VADLGGAIEKLGAAIRRRPRVASVGALVLAASIAAASGDLPCTKCMSARVQTGNLTESVELYRKLSGYLPGQLDELSFVLPGRTKPVVDAIVRDPWGQLPRYRVDGARPIVWSLGPDGQDGTPDDVYPWTRCSAIDGCSCTP